MFPYVSVVTTTGLTTERLLTTRERIGRKTKPIIAMKITETIMTF